MSPLGYSVSLVPRLLPVFNVALKNWEKPGDEAVMQCDSQYSLVAKYSWRYYAWTKV